MDRKIVKKAAEIFYESIKDMPVENEIIVEARKKVLEKEWYFILESLLKKAYPDYSTAQLKYKTADYYTDDAKKLVDANNFPNGGLVFEHIIPKKEYIIEECFTKDKDGKITGVKSKNAVVKLFEERHWVAVITKNKDKKLSRTKMPKDWNGKFDEESRLARYKAAGIKLNPATN